MNTSSSTVKYVVKWYKSVQKPELGFQERNCYSERELKELIAILKCKDRTYRIIRQSDE